VNTSERTPEGIRPRIPLQSFETFKTLQIKRNSILKMEIICMELTFLQKFLKIEKNGNKVLFLQAEKWCHDTSIGTWVKSNMVHP
jgi:hypothetical protein